MFKDGKPIFHYNSANVAHYNIAAKDTLTPGKHTIVFDFKYDGGGIGKGGTGTLSVDGKQVTQGRIANTMPVRFSFDETFDIGEDTDTPVSEDYDVPFKFTGKNEPQESLRLHPSSGECSPYWEEQPAAMKQDIMKRIYAAFVVALLFEASKAQTVRGNEFMK